LCLYAYYAFTFVIITVQFLKLNVYYLDSPETVDMLKKEDIVYISTFVDLHAIYVRRINNGTDKFKSFLENFSSSCALGK